MFVPLVHLVQHTIRVMMHLDLVPLVFLHFVVLINMFKIIHAYPVHLELSIIVKIIVVDPIQYVM